MAEEVAYSLGQGEILITEAGTGVGKTFAYLVPSLLCGQRVIISTGTRHLQDQLYHRDLPRVQKALGVGLKSALLKGRANYLCIHRLQQAQQQPADVDSIGKLQSIKNWSKMTKSGDISEFADIPESDSIWQQATSTVDNCLGTECPEFNQCHLVKARRQAQEADLVVINHHLFFADMALKDEGFGEVLPSADAFVLDESHQLPETASRFFGQSISSRQVDTLIREAVAAQLAEAADVSGFRKVTDSLTQALREFRLQLGKPSQKAHWQSIAEKPEVKNAYLLLQQRLQECVDQLQNIAEHGQELKKCFERFSAANNRLALFDEKSVKDILWFETTAHGFILYATPVEIGVLFNQYMQRFPAAWIFTSATLSVGGHFDHFQQRIGIAEARTALFDSPFDYKKQSLLYLPDDIPDPSDPDYIDQVISASRPVIAASEGRAFVLFTSHRALRYAASLLQDQFDYPLFVQGDAPRSQLLDNFRHSGNGVLLGTSSFWEGVDIRGEALSCVIIDKLPFAAPNDPVLQARLELMRQQGLNPFTEYQIPQAVIALKQGAGRLIRDVTDRGVLMIADPRLRSRAYGKLFLASLPDIPVTHNIDDVQQFFKV